MLISDSIDQFLKPLKKSPKTQASYRNGLKSFSRFMEQRVGHPPTMDDLYEAMVVDFEQWLGDGGLKPSSIKTYIAGVFGWLDNTVLRRTLPPTLSIEYIRALYKDSQKRTHYETRDAKEFNDIPKLVAQLNIVPEMGSEPKKVARYLGGLRNRAFALFIYNTGARQGTARTLMLSQICDANGGILEKIKAKGKGDKSGILILDMPEARAALAEYLEARKTVRPDKSNFVFISHDRDYGEPICSQTAWKIVHYTAKELGLDFSPHDFRHHWAIHKLQQGVPLKAISDGLWHKNISTTSTIYAGYEDDKLVSVIKSAPMPAIGNGDAPHK